MSEVVELLAKTPCAGKPPLSIGEASLNEVDWGAITSVAPFAGQEQAVSEALKAHVGARFPAPGRMTGKTGARVVWAGLEQAFVLGPAVAALKGAAVTDQSDAWTCVELEGVGARAVLARVTPLDLRPGVFKSGHAARTQLAHMSAVVMRLGENRFGIMVFRSMARTLVHDLQEAMRSVAGRAAL
ncbi:sarcosine oxidase subunit gamma [Aquicoccus sp. G2-2]|uniref:sarcosine oxidase subunit gamma n=1 Tax=Aquicoccus sp. G2-2 TaxID=3092120 RepID=UPI002AE071EB|nr:sarcosine oxidase subunit gamma family protein [Aquicoccus sp. G2-2]MEA1113840.1 sarcosine oxidase subunit gamma family protein [Aquicoccus sp. G2-2]